MVQSLEVLESEETEKVHLNTYVYLISFLGVSFCSELSRLVPCPKVQKYLTYLSVC